MTSRHEPGLQVLHAGNGSSSTASQGVRRLPVGAELQDNGVHFRVWAPELATLDVIIEGHTAGARLQRAANGYHASFVGGLQAGTRYWFKLPDGRRLPDPASRFQPDGPHGASEVIDPGSFSWTDASWRGAGLRGQVIYELHIGTFTPEGSWRAAMERLDDLASDGITVVEVMPVATFPGRFGWGYDGVDLFAPVALYGRPDDMRAFVDAAHVRGIAVILDVVYNHFGPDGNYLEAFSPHYFSSTETEWGRAINYDGKHAGPVRELVAENAAFWISEYHLDGLRLDATQCIYDQSPEHIVAELTRRARAAAGERPIIVVAENEPQQTRLLRPASAGGDGLDGLWNDDFHHSALVAATGKREAYYSDYLGTAQEFVSAAKHGYLYQGQHYLWQKQRRGQPSRGLAPWRFVAYLENHDQVANSLRGARLCQSTIPARARALSALLMLGPWTPMLLQGQEWNASAPFLYFADHKGDLAGLVKKGRGEFLMQFPSCATVSARKMLLDPGLMSTFERCRLDWSERDRSPHREARAMHRELAEIKRGDATLAGAGDGLAFDGAVLSPACFLLRFFGADDNGADDRLLLVNLGRELRLSPAPEPLLAPPEGLRWQPRFSSEDPRWGGDGAADVELEQVGWVIPAESTGLLVAGVPEDSSHADT